MSKIIENIRYELSMIDKKKLFIKLVPYIFIYYIFNKIRQMYRGFPEDNFFIILYQMLLNLENLFKPPFPSFHPKDIAFGIIGALAVYLIVYTKGRNARKYRKGEEYGSARWENPKDIRPYIDPMYEENIILTQTERLMMNGRPKNPKYARNKKGRIIYEPYNIKVLNTINFKKSMHYNPFEHIHSEKDILKLVNTIIANTKGEGEKAGEDFWVKAEKLYYTALIGYIYYKAPKEEQNFLTLLEMINVSEAREDDENFKNPVDLLFDALEEIEPDHFALRQYKKYKLAAGKTAKSILISCGARLAPFDIKELRDLMEYDEMELDTLGDRKTALFIIISDTDDTFNFIVAMMYTQLFNLLCAKADDVYGGRLPIHVRFLLDEFANIGQIPKFEKLIATIRSREISASIILQAQSQLKAIYKDSADTIIGNCDTMLFLGGKEKSTLKEISEVLGKETIDLYNQSENRGRERSYGTNYQKLGKELMSQDELAVMDSGKCILQLRGVRPFLSDKFDITKHKNYRYLSDYDEKNNFEVDKCLNKEWRIRGKEEVEIYEYEN